MDDVETIKLGLIGSAGRMGLALKEALAGVEDIVLHAALDLDGDPQEFIAASPDVVVDLSLGAAVEVNGPLVVAAGLPYIIGATGISDKCLEQLAKLAADNGTPVLVVPNFSLGANLMIRFAASAARLMGAPAITERHHEKKADAPSGTAHFTAQRIAKARDDAGVDIGDETYMESVDGVMGGLVDSVPIHSIRGPGYLAEQEVRLTLPGESLAIEHKSIDRRCFMPGIIYSIRNIRRVEGLQTGLDVILDT